ncbi:MAG: hypothetical protein ACRDI2_20425 [Chloroflexota bacterium]
MRPATIYVNLHRRLGAIEPYVYGQIIEQLFDVVDGAIFDEVSPQADEAGFRRANGHDERWGVPLGGSQRGVRRLAGRSHGRRHLRRTAAPVRVIINVFNNSYGIGSPSKQLELAWELLA